MIKIKICGITNYDDAIVAAGAGADMLGINFYNKSPRYVSPEDARDFCNRLRETLEEDCPLLIGVFVNPTSSDVSRIMATVGLDFAQLSGSESVEMLAELRGLAFKAIRPRNKLEATADIDYYMLHAPHDERIPAMMVDAHHAQLHGGTGEQASAEVVEVMRARVPRFMLAGGLTPENVAERIIAHKPWGVDVASGVETDEKNGAKDPLKVDAFALAVARQVGAS